MPNLIYRVVSACAALGYGYPRESLQAALRGRIDAIICDAGSIDAGPYFLGTGTDYFEADAIKADYRHMVEAGRRIGCPVVIGSSGMAGGNRNLDRMIEIAKEVFSELAIRDSKVAVIRSELDPDIVLKEYRKGALQPTGVGPDLDEDELRGSIIVGQMGVHPLISALDAGAQFIFAGRSCDSALFASDMIRRGIDAGLAYHVGHVLESGALACEPGSPSDCLVAEIYDDGTAIFVAPNSVRRCTAHSIAAHSLYQQSHPQLQYYPEGVLTLEKTQFFSRDSRSAGIRSSRFMRTGRLWPWSIKLEGAFRIGARKVSLIGIDPSDAVKVPSDMLLYGRNGVQAGPVEGSEVELGIIVETAASTRDKAIMLARMISHHLAHHGYAGRKTSTGNLAYPLSPDFVCFRRSDGLFGAVIPSGTRDQEFIGSFEAIKAEVVALIADEPAAIGADFTISDTRENPVVLLRTVDRDPARLAVRHQQEIDRLLKSLTPKTSSRLNLDAPDAFGWSLYHLLQNEGVIKDVLFPITYFSADGANWIEVGSDRPHYDNIGEAGYRGNLDERTLSVIADHPPLERSVGSRRLRDMAAVIRSKDAGVNRITFDIFFTSGESYEIALYSNAFSRDNVARALDIAPEHLVGTFFVDSCNAIKVSIDRPNISASMDERDLFGVQQQTAIESMDIPIYAAALSKASSF
ncbi:DUF4387 family protein [Bradyrhizobium symbiodeficiens]|uniref:DUF4387 family protein n=1 Tax=Bradyrhizobium symbiodeficiens TaxID=1404367 RepID=A0A6G9A024_9BRAD|nr:DUF4387 family protein [Bradyrhizobium symbiodeficiens]QIP05800.1 DUF4387 family protein [Bradyrhizobium symbiodeficiens]